MTMIVTVAAAAAGVGAVHTLAPDHWVPFAALARAQGWSARRTAAVTAACGLGHVTVSVALGLLGLFFGLELLQAFGTRLETISGVLLIAFGLTYAAWGVHRRVRGHTHVHGYGQHVRECSQHVHESSQHLHECSQHVHRHNEHPHAHSRQRPLTAWTLFLLFSADPCVAVIPLIFTAAPLGWPSALVVCGAYEAATIGTMVALVLPARLAATSVRARWADRWSDALAGGVVAGVGLAVIVLGI